MIVICTSTAILLLLALSKAHLMMFQAMHIEAELKREEEKSKGGPTGGEAKSAADNNNNQDIVLFEENEDEEEEEESDEDDDQSTSQARGRAGANMLPWQPHMQPRGPVTLGLRGFPPTMLGPDGFGFGPANGFGMPDMFGMPRFPPFGGPRPGPMVFPGIRPSQPGPPMFPMGGLGMMMGPGGRGGPFMGPPNGIPMGPLGRPNRPMGMPPVALPPPNVANRAGKRDQWKLAGEWQENGRERRDPDIGTEHETDHQPEGRNETRDEESESEEEVGPRRQREGKRRRRGSDRDSASPDHRN
jgi:cleavage and polyadenylation specificity factor subunit 4